MFTTESKVTMEFRALEKFFKITPITTGPRFVGV